MYKTGLILAGFSLTCFLPSVHGFSEKEYLAVLRGYCTPDKFLWLFMHFPQKLHHIGDK